MTQSRITRFYAGDGLDDRGRSLADLQAQSLDELEYNHDYIQWLFPLPERSSANPSAPLLTAADLAAFAASLALRDNLLRSLAVLLRFYGLELRDTPAGFEVRRAQTFAQRSKVWLTPYNHNFLRLTRILRSLSLLDCASHAAALFQCLEDIYRESHAIIGAETFRYWKSAQC
jgi:hypothetical protein